MTIYLDHNATTPVAPEAITEMLDAMQRAWANPSSTHEAGQAARRLLTDARARVATFLGALPTEVVFTSGATEANHAAVLGARAVQRPTGRGRLVLTAVEHPGLLALAQRLRSEGTPVDLLPVQPDGRLDLEAAARLITPDVALVSVMAANNETGVRMPLAEVAALAHAAGALLHTDATQVAGKEPFCFADSQADLASVSAHKLHGPKGVGALLVRKGLTLPPLLAGRQERHRRGGTENLPGIAGFAAACDVARARIAEDSAQVRALRDRLERGLRDVLPQAHVYGASAPRIGNTSCMRFGELESERVLGKLERAGVLASSGAACTASGTQPSHVLLAMGAPLHHAKATVRFSLGRATTAEAVDRAIEAAARALGPLLADSPATPLAA